jgi:hypothetical protein
VIRLRLFETPATETQSAHPSQRQSFPASGSLKHRRLKPSSLSMSLPALLRLRLFETPATETALRAGFRRGRDPPQAL